MVVKTSLGAKPRFLFCLGAIVATVGCASPGPHAATPAAARGSECRTASVALEVLGSGGPIPESDRASASYLLWRKGKARVLVDAGGGSFLRFAEAGASIEDLDAILVSHLHADHVGDLVPLLKGGYFADRTRPLPLVGPTGNADFPAMDEFLRRELDPERGSYRYLSGYLDGKNGLFAVPIAVVDPAGPPRVVLRGDELVVEAAGVHHGHVPALGFVVTLGGKRVAFGGDQSGAATPFWPLARGVDVLVVHHAVPDSATGNVTDLHATPSTLGRLAADANAKRLVLGHTMLRAWKEREEGLVAIRRSYAGDVTIAEDLQCFVLTP